MGFRLCCEESWVTIAIGRTRIQHCIYKTSVTTALQAHYVFSERCGYDRTRCVMFMIII